MSDYSRHLLIDFYQLTMAQGYWLSGNNPRVVFEMFFRRQPFQGGFSVFAGLRSLLDELEHMRFTERHIDYLASLDMFDTRFLEYLRAFKFTGDIYSVAEGELIFPFAPVVRAHATLIEAQLIETALLNLLNFQSLIATKTARIYLASREGNIVEMGLRRAQGPNGALSATRAAYIGGASGTSNTEAAMQYGIPIRGTMGHAWVMSFQNEKSAFQQYADIYPHTAVLLVDTYNTLKSGLDNAIAIGLKLRKQGRSIGIRLDSGDIQYLSAQARNRLDRAGLRDAKIIVSNELNEQIIHQLVTDKAPVDIWGVGSNMVTGAADASFSGVYKMAAKEIAGEFAPTMKYSDNPEKSTNPGIKQVFRFFDSHHSPQADLIALIDDTVVAGKTYTLYHPFDDRQTSLIKTNASAKPLLSCYMKQGAMVETYPSLRVIRERTLANLANLDVVYTRIINPHIYKVSISKKLLDLKMSLQASLKASQ